MTNAGTATTVLAIPDAPALVGQTLHLQTVLGELGAGSAITSSNALVLTIGSY